MTINIVEGMNNSTFISLDQYQNLISTITKKIIPFLLNHHYY